MIVAIQKYLWVDKVNWQLVEGKDFSELKIILMLCCVMKEHTEVNIGVTKMQAQVTT